MIMSAIGEVLGIALYLVILFGSAILWGSIELNVSIKDFIESMKGEDE